MKSCARESMEQKRWWMDCQPHIRVLQGAVRSSKDEKAVEGPLQSCVALYTADLHHHYFVDDEKVLLMISGRKFTTVEASFMWLGGWRPTSAVLLVYSLMGVQLQDEVRGFGNGIQSLVRSEAVLTEKQLHNLRNVQKRAREDEKMLQKRLTTIQMLVSDQDVIAAVMIESSTSRSKTDMKTVLKPRMSRLKKLLIQADQLRLQTLHHLFFVLTPVQVAHCAIAAFELAFTMRAVGLSMQSRTRGYSKCLCHASPTINISSES